MIDIDQFFDRKFERHKYTCGHFVAEVYKAITGINIDEICSAGVIGNVEVYRRLRSQRIKLIEPVSPCVVIMQAEDFDTHAGVFIDGNIFHLLTDGVRFHPMSELNPKYRLSFYK